MLQFTLLEPGSHRGHNENGREESQHSNEDGQKEFGLHGD
jgi:hypothetical protein